MRFCDLSRKHVHLSYPFQARNQDFIWGEGGGGANEAKVDQSIEMHFLLSDLFIYETSNK